MMQEFVKSVKDSAKKAIQEIHTAVPAEIVSYNADVGMAVVQPKAKFKQPTGESIEYPLISNVPVVFPHSKNISIAFPVLAGDECLLVFSETALDYWRYGNETDTELNFDLSNAVAIVGLDSLGNEAMQIACDENAAVIKADDVVLKVKNDGVYVVGDLNISGTIKSSGGTMSVEEGKTSISGMLEINGSVVVSEDVIADREVSLCHHVHKYDGNIQTSEPIK